MKRVRTAGLLIAGLLLSGGSDVMADTTKAAATERFVVTYFSSHTGAGVACHRALTAITVVNNSTRDCRIRVNFFDSSEPVTAACSIGASVGPGVASNF